MTVTLSEIHIFPIKALGGIALDHAALTTRGLAHDRRFMVIDTNNDLVTQREIPKMATVWVELENGEITFSAPDLDNISFPAVPPELPSHLVRVWASHVPAHPVSPEVDRWLSAYLDADVRLVYMPDSSERKVNPQFAKNNEIVSFADGYPVLIASEESLADLNARIVAGGASALPMNRFRPNLVVKGCEAFAEDHPGEVYIGDAIFRTVKPCVRCQVTTTDQATGEVLGPEPLRTLATYRDSPDGVQFGMNLIAVKLGNVRVGDVVRLAT